MGVFLTGVQVPKASLAFTYSSLPSGRVVFSPTKQTCQSFLLGSSESLSSPQTHLSHKEVSAMGRQAKRRWAAAAGQGPVKGPQGEGRKWIFMEDL